MEKQRGTKVVAAIALIVAIIGVSVGFAAFSATLTITNPTVTMNKGDESNLFSSKLKITAIKCDGVTGDIASVENGINWKGASLTLNTGESKICEATVTNTSDYDAYLNSIELSGTISCGASTDQTGQYVNTICNELKMDVYGGNETSYANATTTKSNGNLDIDGEVITKDGGTGKITFKVTHDGTTIADADITAVLPTMTFTYGTVE